MRACRDTDSPTRKVRKKSRANGGERGVKRGGGKGRRVLVEAGSNRDQEEKERERERGERRRRRRWGGFAGKKTEQVKDEAQHSTYTHAQLHSHVVHESEAQEGGEA